MPRAAKARAVASARGETAQQATDPAGGGLLCVFGSDAWLESPDAESAFCSALRRTARRPQP